jgi:hypothetical protein
VPVELPNFHDAVLLDVRLDFDCGIVELRLGLVGETERVARVRCTRFRRVVVDRDLPWGPSASVNGISGGDERLDVELQSGDHVVIYGEHMTTMVVVEDEAEP